MEFEFAYEIAIGFAKQTVCVATFLPQKMTVQFIIPADPLSICTQIL